MLNNTKFQGTIDGKKVDDYRKRVDWDVKEEDKRLELINEILNLDELGSKDEFWQEVWDCGICKSNINTTDTRWEETNVAQFLETLGTYLIHGYNKKEKKIYNEVELNESLTSNDVVNDKNYRLAPPDTLKQSDYKVRDLFDGTYKEYVEKVNKTPYEIKEEESWERIKHNEEEKVKLLTEAKRNLDILKAQSMEMQLGKRLQYNEKEIIQIPKMNVNLRLSEQLKRYGLDNADVLDIEDKIYFSSDRTSNVMLWHITSNLKDMKDYMIMCKLAYTNRVKIKPPKCPVVRNILDYIDYLDPTHIRAILPLGEMELDPANDLAIISNDINKKINVMYERGELSNRDMYVIDGFKHNVPIKEMARELDRATNAIHTNIERVCERIVKSFYKDYIDNYFLNVKKGKYKCCNRCSQVKLTNQFNKNGKKGLMPMCKKCEAERKRNRKR